MNIPSESDCLRMMDRMRMLKNISRHSQMVKNVAVFLAEHLAPHNMELNLDLVRASSFLHDITKTRSLETGEVHSQTGCEYLTGQGFPEVGDIVRQHVVLDRYRVEGPPLEAEIVNYADKRILHDQLVSLDKRMAYILERYGIRENRMAQLKQVWKQTESLEKKLFGFLTFDPEDLKDLLPPA